MEHPDDSNNILWYPHIQLVEEVEEGIEVGVIHN